jgi:cytochrome c oxidase subunit 4
MHDTNPSATDIHAGSEHGLGHVVPLYVLITVFVALVVLTWITVAVTMIDLGSLNLWIALAIATVKASLVVLYFMHLRYDRPFNAIILVTALLFLFLFLGITIMDTIEYQPQIEQMRADQTAGSVDHAGVDHLVINRVPSSTGR